MISRTILSFIAIFIIGTIGGIFADQILWPYFIERPLFFEYRLEKRPIYVTEKKEVTIEENTALQEAVKKVEEIVVAVESGSLGSGFIITSDGLIVTSSLILNGEVVVYYQGEELDAEIVKKGTDLTLLRVNKDNLPTQGFNDSRIGERVFLVGKIFKKDEFLTLANQGIIKYLDSGLIHTNIFESNVLKGSPLFDIEGNILGLNIIDSQGKVISIPASTIKSFSGL